MKIIVIILAVLALALAGGYYVGFDIGFEKAVKKDEAKVQKEENIQATFLIFTNGTLRDFTSSKYHNQSKDVFITAENPNVVNVKKKGITWNDFFKTMPAPMEITKDCLTTGTGQKFCTGANGSLKFFLNRQRDDNLLSKEIKKGDKVLITYGNESEQEIQTQLSFLE